MLVRVIDMHRDQLRIPDVVTMLVREGASLYEIPRSVINCQIDHGIYLVDDSYLNYDTLIDTFYFFDRKEIE